MIRLPSFKHPARLQTLSAKLTAQYALIFALAMLCVAGALFSAISKLAQRQVEQQLVASSAVYDRLWQQRSSQMQDAAQILASDFGFREALATNDQATVSSALHNLKKRLKVTSAFVIGLDGSITGLNDPKMQSEAATLWDVLDQGKFSGVAVLNGNAQQLVAAPIMTPDLNGWIVFGAAIDMAEMGSLEKLSAIPLEANVLIKAHSDHWRGVTGTFDRKDPLLSQTIDQSMRTRDTSFTLDLAGKSSIALARPLPVISEGTDAVLVLAYPRSAAMAQYWQMQVAVLLVSMLGLFGVVYATWRTARRISHPIALLDQASQRLAEGNTATVEIASSDEIGRLAASFNHMVNEIEEREKRITQLAFNDTLTGLPNRVMFQQQLDYLLRNSAQKQSVIALYSLDLDHFKTINDTLGHPVGDALLTEVGARLSSVARKCFVARLGGDEFVVIQVLDAERHDIERLCQDMIKTVARPLTIDGHVITPGTSIGIAIAPEDGADTQSLMRNADLALSRAKEAGRGTFCFFEESLNDRAQTRRRVEADLRIAIEQGQFELYFQPLFDLEKNRIGSFEALLRWNHPEHGKISPVDFIPIAEETGLIIPIGEWALRDACRQAMQWPEHVRVAVNVSSVQFRGTGLHAAIQQALIMSGLAPQRLEIEITESIFLDDSDSTLDVLHRLRATGIRIALDDFGTGYSSLSYLQSFPFDKIKIDRSFIQDIVTRPSARAIIKAITDLAGALGMETTAEGVEEAEQLAELRNQGCSSVQGFIFSKPVSAQDAVAMLGAEKAGDQRAA